MMPWSHFLKRPCIHCFQFSCICHPTSPSVVPHCWWKSMLISIEATWTSVQVMQSKDLSGTSVQVIQSIIPVSLFPGSADFSNCIKGSESHLCRSHSAVCCRCFWIIIAQQSGNHARKYPACNYWTHCSVVRPWAFSKEVLLNTSLSQGCIT